LFSARLVHGGEIISQAILKDTRALC
jgi:hypothetical protein